MMTTMMTIHSKTKQHATDYTPNTYFHNSNNNNNKKNDDNPTTQKNNNNTTTTMTTTDPLHRLAGDDRSVLAERAFSTLATGTEPRLPNHG